MFFEIDDGDALRDTLLEINEHVRSFGFGKLVRLTVSLELLKYKYEHPNVIDSMRGEDNSSIEYLHVKPTIEKLLRSAYETMDER